VIKLSKNHSIQEISEILNTSYSVLYKLVKEKGIKTKVTRRNNSKRKIQNKEELYRLYINEGKSMKEISEYYNTTPATVLHALNRFGISTRLQNGKDEINEPKHSKETLENLYYKEKKSLHEIAKILDYPHGSYVKIDMEKHGIERRNYKEAGAVLYEQHPEKIELHREQLYDRITNFGNYHKDTWIELYFKEWCNSKDIGFIHQFQIEKNTHRFDFLIEGTNIIVEMDGVFWHSSPEQIERDKGFVQYANDNGYKVVRITDEELKEFGETIIEERLVPCL
jgi:very-short-patch-repair endonuclease/DNA-binding CsgD family transcriptional regulator